MSRQVTKVIKVFFLHLFLQEFATLSKAESFQVGDNSFVSEESSEEKGERKGILSRENGSNSALSIDQNTGLFFVLRASSEQLGNAEFELCLL